MSWSAWANDNNRLQEITKEIEKSNQKVKSLNVEQKEYAKKISIYKKRLEDAQKNLNSLSKKETVKAKKKRSLESEIKLLNQKISELEMLSFESFRSLYEAEYIEEDPQSSQFLSFFVHQTDKQILEIMNKNDILLDNSQNLAKEINSLNTKKKNEKKNISFAKYVTGTNSSSLEKSVATKKKILDNLSILKSEKEKIKKIIAGLNLKKVTSGYTYKFSEKGLVWPVKGEILKSKLNVDGIDIKTKDKYALAIDDGVVAKLGNIGNKKYLIIDHLNGYVSTYVYKGNTLISFSSPVKRAQKLIELSQNTIHFEIRRDKKYPIDPLTLLGKE